MKYSVMRIITEIQEVECDDIEYVLQQALGYENRNNWNTTIKYTIEEK